MPVYRLPLSLRTLRASTSTTENLASQYQVHIKWSSLFCVGKKGVETVTLFRILVTMEGSSIDVGTVPSLDASSCGKYLYGVGTVPGQGSLDLEFTFRAAMNVVWNS